MKKYLRPYIFLAARRRPQYLVFRLSAGYPQAIPWQTTGNSQPEDKFRFTVAGTLPN
jgi:hypothetical protein